MLYLKSYCYSKHELPFVIANLQEGYKYIDKLILYEYNFTHTGIKKNYEFEKVLHLVPLELRDKLEYKKIDISNYVEYAYENGPLIHKVNEPIQRSWLFNDPDYNLQDEDIIFDHDIDEILYEDSYIELIEELQKKKRPLSVKLNQFFFKRNWFWKNCNFSSPTIYTYKMVKNSKNTIKGLKIRNLRDLRQKTDKIYGCHMSWVMPISYMIKKFECYSHPEFRKYSDEKLLTEAIEKREYIFDKKRDFTIVELDLCDVRIPKFLQSNEIFNYIHIQS